MAQKYKTGDILVVGTWPIPMFNHFAIVFYKDCIGYVAHNSFRSKKIMLTGLDEFTKSRKIWKVIPTDGKLTNEEIYNKTVELNKQGKTYNFFGYNCEEYVREVCQCNWGMDQRKEFIIFIVIVIIIIVVINQLIKILGK